MPTCIYTHPTATFPSSLYQCLSASRRGRVVHNPQRYHALLFQPLSICPTINTARAVSVHSLFVRSGSYQNIMAHSRSQQRRHSFYRGSCLYPAVAISGVDRKEQQPDGKCREAQTPESYSGIWKRASFLWLAGTFRKGYAKVLSVHDLPELVPKLNSQSVARELQDSWRQVSK